MLVSDFDFLLPEELIAQEPPALRGDSRMLRLHRATGAVEDRLFSELPELLSPGDLLVLNDSRVLPARLFARRAGLRTQGGTSPEGWVEVLLTEWIGSGGGGNVWRALVKPAKKVSVGETLLFPARTFGAATVAGEVMGEPLLTAEVIAAGEFGERTLQFARVSDFYGVLEGIGFLPLPPYIRRSRAEPNSAADRERYQTVYSVAAEDREGGWQDPAPQIADPTLHTEGPRQENRPAGSAAAPTAGLHFTSEVLQRLEKRGVEVARITLHVGLGTFQPVRVERTEEIRLHHEPYTLDAPAAGALNRAWAEGRRVIAVGTTTTRTLEHLARRFEAEHGPLSIGNPLRLQPHAGSTGLFLSPAPAGDDRFLLVQGLLTNFHLPQSTLLMLVSAFAGRERTLAAYAHAVGASYRFFSYGDCMLLL